MVRDKEVAGGSGTTTNLSPLNRRAGRDSEDVEEVVLTTESLSTLSTLKDAGTEAVATEVEETEDLTKRLDITTTPSPDKNNITRATIKDPHSTTTKVITQGMNLTGNHQDLEKKETEIWNMKDLE